MTTKERGSVQHVASTITGQLAPGRTSWDAFATVFPIVAAAGIPMRAACELIEATEFAPRGLYSGAVLTASSSAALDAALVLRSVFRQQGRTIPAGAGSARQVRG